MKHDSSAVSVGLQDFRVDWLRRALIFEPLEAGLIAYRIVRGPYVGV